MVNRMQISNGSGFLKSKPMQKTMDDFGQEEEQSDEEIDLKTKVRVIVRIRPLLDIDHEVQQK